MKPRHKVYTSEEEILAAIDWATAKLKWCRARCTELDCLMAECRRVIAKPKNRSEEIEAAEALACHESENLKVMKRARGIEDNTLPKLKRTLAAFRTRTFNFMGDYQGVVAA